MSIDTIKEKFAKGAILNKDEVRDLCREAQKIAGGKDRKLDDIQYDNGNSSIPVTKDQIKYVIDILTKKAAPTAVSSGNKKYHNDTHFLCQHCQEPIDSKVKHDSCLDHLLAA